MFINTKNIAVKALAFISAAALTLTSCVQLGEEQESAYGYLTISGFDVDVQVEQLVPTKGLDLPTISEPYASTIVYKVTDKDGKTYQSNEESWSNPLRIPVGSYTLEAWSGSNSFGSPYFYGKKENGSIDVGNNTGTVTLSVANSLVAVTLGDNVSDHFTAAGGNCVKLSDGTSSIETTLDNYVFVPSGKNLTVFVTGNNTAGGTAKEYNVGISKDDVKPGFAHNVILSVTGDLPDITFTESNVVAWGNAIFITSPATASSGNVDMSKVTYKARVKGETDWTHTAKNNIISGLESGKTYEVIASVGALSSTPFTPSVVGNVKASAKHSDTNGEDPGGYLDGTDLSIDAGTLPDKVKGNCSFTLYDANNNNIRTFTDLEFDGSKATDGWPYLPQGNYTLEATATIDNVTVSSMAGIEVPAPSFTVTSGAYTSYSKYLEGDSNAANDCNAETIYDLQEASPNIVSSLLNNSNYQKSTTCSISLDDSANSSESVGTLSWGQHVVKASYTFDNTPCSSEYTLHITGLPYKPVNMVEADWKFSSWNCKYDNGTIQLGGVSGSGECTATSKMDFHIPENINIKINTNVSVRDYDVGLIWVETAFTLFVNEKSVISQDGNRQDNNNTGKNYNLSGNSTFTTNSCSIKLNSSYEAAGPWSKVHSLHILYR